jgi:hypothetical protein
VIASGGVRDYPSLVGFTPSDELIISVREGLWIVSRNGNSASRLFVRDAGCCYTSAPFSPLYMTSPQGFIAMISRKPASDGSTSDATDLLSSSGAVIHQFPGGDPLSFSPDGRYLLIDLVNDFTNGTTPVPEEACSTRTFTCAALPGLADPEWLPDGNLAIGSNSANVAGLGFKWWNVGTRDYVPVPPAFKKLGSIFYVLPARLMAAARSTLEAGHPASGG